LIIYLYHKGCVIFGTRLRKNPKKYAKEKELLGWKDMVVWKDFRSLYILEVVWVEYIHHVTSEHFMRRSQSSAKNQNMQIHGSITTHTDEFILFVLHVKQMIIYIFLLDPFFLKCCFIWIFLTYNSFLLQNTILERGSRSMKLFVEMHVRNDDRRKGV
jgi:hypothetical protein